MINNWDIISRFDSQRNSRLFTLVIDGTENDARLIAKKLAGYVQPPTSAQPPFTYAFTLPSDLDEETLDKIRVAVREGAEQANKVNQFVPGGTLGSPLFNTTTSLGQTQTTPKIELDPADTFLQENVTQKSTTPPAEDVVEETPTDSAAAKQETPAPADNPAPSSSDGKPSNQPAITLSDKDMLIKDMEDTLLGKMPLEDIFAAQTKYDMFMDIQSQSDTDAKNQQEQKINRLEVDVSHLDDSFNIFDQKIKEATSIMDVNDLNLPEQEGPSSPTQENLDTVQGLNVSVHSVQTGLEEDGGEQTHSNSQIPEEMTLENTIPPQTPPSTEDLPDIAVREQTEPLERTFNLESTVGLNTLRTQYEKSFHTEKPIPVEQGNVSEPEEKPADEPAAEGHPAQTTLHLRLKQTSKPEKTLKDTPPTGKTILRLRAKPQPQAPQPPAPKTPVPPATEKTVLHLRKAPPPATPKAPAPAGPKPAPKPEPAPKQEVVSAAEKTKTIDYSIELPFSELKKHNWPLEVPLLPTYTLENFVLSVNRFAHATAISVIDNPGKMYNPLVFHGTTGTGKTHFLNALAYGFSKKYGQENIFMTNGVRLSRGIQRYVMEGNVEKFEKFMDSVKVLLIDDIHLLAINEQNRAHISKLLNKFLKEQKQIVITSKYPPESLGKLENLIKFHLDSGWISELKAATGASHFKIVKTMLLGNGVDLDDSQITQFFGGSHMTLSTIMRSIRRLKVLENLVFPHLEESQRSQADMFEKLLATKGEDPTSEILSRDPASVTSISTVGNGEWGRLGFFYPSNSSNAMNWMVYALEQRAKELGVSGGFDIAVRSSYSTENIISSAFKIANLCDNKKLRGAVILGPALTVCEPSVRENFYDILTHMLEIMLIRCGIINTEALRLPSTYVKVISELLR